jgi:ribonucleases P/MRP protein subunit RPP40
LEKSPSPLIASIMPSVFDFATGDSGLNSKMHVSQGSLPPYIDPAQPPTKKSPWRQIKEMPFVHSVTLLMPDEFYELVWGKLDVESKTVKYSKVIMKLQEVLEGDFFTEYIKKGQSYLS